MTDFNKIALGITGACACHEAFTSRKLIDPNSHYHDFNAEIVDALRKVYDDERERCAQIADTAADLLQNSGYTFEGVAAAIRDLSDDG